MRDHDNTHTCPIPGCKGGQLPVGILMCWDHWKLVPFRVRNDVTRAWNGGKPVANYMEVRQAAINAVIDAVGVQKGGR